MVRSPSAGAGDALAARIDLLIAETLLAERVQSFAYWIGSVCTLLVIGGDLPLLRDPAPLGVVGGRGRPRQTRRPGASNAAGPHCETAVIGIVATAFLIPLRTIALSGGEVSAATDGNALWFVLTSRFGDSAVLRIAGLAICYYCWPTGAAVAGGPAVGRGPPVQQEPLVGRAGRRRAAFVPGTLVVLLGYARTATRRRPTRGWYVAAQWLHITVAAAWFGGVAFLGIELRQQWRRGRPGTRPRWWPASSLAEVTIVVAWITGVLLANSQIHDPTAVLQSAYGRAFVGKMVALGVVLAVGGYNQQRLVPAIVERDEPRRLGPPAPSGRRRGRPHRPRRAAHDRGHDQRRHP